MTNNDKKQRSPLTTGFSLIEAMIAVLLVGLVVTALMLSNGSLTKVNAAGVDLSTAEFLIEQMREHVVALPYADLAALAAASPYSPPIDVNGNALAQFTAFSQQVTVQTVSPADLITPQAGSDFSRVTVSVLLNGSPINSATWIRSNL